MQSQVQVQIFRRKGAAVVVVGACRGPSTTSFAKCANDFAQDDGLCGGWGRTDNGKGDGNGKNKGDGNGKNKGEGNGNGEYGDSSLRMTNVKV